MIIDRLIFSKPSGSGSHWGSCSWILTGTEIGESLSCWSITEIKKGVRIKNEKRYWLTYAK